MAYGVDRHPDPPDDGMDNEEREALREAEDRRIEMEIDKAAESRLMPTHEGMRAMVRWSASTAWAPRDLERYFGHDIGLAIAEGVDLAVRARAIAIEARVKEAFE